MKRWVWLGVLLLPAIAQGVTVGGNCRWTWTPPTTNADGTPLTDLAKYRMYWASTSNGQVKGSFQAEIPAPANQALCQSIGFPAGHWFVKLTASDTIGNESAFGNEVDVLVDPLSPAAPLSLSVQ